MSWRRDPRAMRSAISLARSAARAAKRLPRLAHAASRMRPAEQHESGHKGAGGLAQGIAGESGAGEGEFQAVIRFGIGLGQRGGDGVQVRGGRCRRDARLEVADDPGRMIAALLQRDTSR